jgi:hypothetical protein
MVTVNTVIFSLVMLICLSGSRCVRYLTVNLFSLFFLATGAPIDTVSSLFDQYYLFIVYETKDVIMIYRIFGCFNTRQSPHGSCVRAQIASRSKLERNTLAYNINNATNSDQQSYIKNCTKLNSSKRSITYFIDLAFSLGVNVRIERVFGWWKFIFSKLAAFFPSFGVKVFA